MMHGGKWTGPENRARNSLAMIRYALANGESYHSTLLLIVVIDTKYCAVTSLTAVRYFHWQSIDTIGELM